MDLVHQVKNGDSSVEHISHLPAMAPNFSTLSLLEVCNKAAFSPPVFVAGAHGKPAGRRMAAVDPTGALVLNAATVPRVLRHPPKPVPEPGSPNGSKKASPSQQQLQQQQQLRQQQEQRLRDAEAAGEHLSWRHFL
eukprot:scaffold286984_cov18-Tisochrysis_lutea.AAC.1